MQNPILEVKNVTTGYKDFWLKKVNFSLEPGDILGLMGRSG